MNDDRTTPRKPPTLRTYSRLAWHLVLPGRMRRALPNPSRDSIEARIAAGDALHTGLVRVVVESALPAEQLRARVGPRERALKVFSDMAVWDTEDNNGVLLYVLLADHAVEIVADRAAARLIPTEQWQALCERLAARYRRSEYLDGTLEAIDQINALLAQAFPAS